MKKTNYSHQIQHLLLFNLSQLTQHSVFTFKIKVGIGTQFYFNSNSSFDIKGSFRITAPHGLKQIWEKFPASSQTSHIL